MDFSFLKAKRQILVQNDLPLLGLGVVCLVKTQLQGKFILPFLKQNGVLLKLDPVRGPAQFFQTSIVQLVQLALFELSLFVPVP